eukprot:scaffold35182_cov56-Phaeocystis_antarctica.AAC.4
MQCAHVHVVHSAHAAGHMHRARSPLPCMQCICGARSLSLTSLSAEGPLQEVRVELLRDGDGRLERGDAGTERFDQSNGRLRERGMLLAHPSLRELSHVEDDYGQGPVSQESCMAQATNSGKLARRRLLSAPEHVPWAVRLPRLQPVSGF